MKLSREQIVTEAIAFLNEAGLADMTLRKLAARLSVQAPSLARHVGDKANLLALVSHRLFCEALDDVPQHVRGSDWMESFGWALWHKQQRIRDLPALLSLAPPQDALDADITRRIQSKLAAAGLREPRHMVAQASIQALVTGWTVFVQSARGTFSLPEDGLSVSLTALIQGHELANTEMV